VPIDRERVAELFALASDLGPEERQGWLASECGDQPELAAEVESLLAAEGSAGHFLEDLDRDQAAELIREDDAKTVPEQTGPYRLLRELGRGGMATVYLGERADDAYRKQVAVKVMRTVAWEPEEMLRRFRTERQVLASLEHPNIAHLLDGGTTEEDRPYVVMEYIDGVPIDEYCERQGLGIDDRIRLFLVVCEAVAHAHKNLVVHRDVKPSNVLVSADGAPKLLDFGIAKLLAPDAADGTMVATREMGRLMTPTYASPEQVRGEAITTATDVYSLGVLLYQLLAGRPPFELAGKSLAEVERVVCGVEPEPPRTGKRDLDNIVLEALRKEPAARYATVGELAEDLRRYLGGLPVSARPATVWYRAGKFVRRHRAGVSAALVAAVVMAATAGYYTRRLAIERDLARAEAAKARQVTELLVGLFRGSSPQQSGRGDVTARELLEEGARKLETELAGQPEIHAELLHTIGGVYFDLGLLEEASELVERALESRRELFGVDSAEVADSRLLLANVRTAQADYDAARELMDQALALRGSLFGEETEEYAEALYGKARVEVFAANDREARDLIERVLALRERLHGPDSIEVAKVLDVLGIVSRRLDDPEQAEAAYRRSLAIGERVLGSEHSNLAPTLNNLGVLLSRTDRLEEARATYARALAIYERAYGPDHDLVAGTLDNLGETLKNLGRAEESIPLVQRALAYREQHLGPDHHATGTTLNTLANIYRELGRYDEAVPLYQRAAKAMAAGLGEDHFWVAWPLGNLAKLYTLRGETALARPLFERSLELRLAALGEEHSLVAGSLEDLARLEEAEGHPAEAIELYRRAAAARRIHPESQRDQLAETLRALAATLMATGAADEAATLEREAAEIEAAIL
jgi:serine/threonine-protein kinase